MNEGKDQVLSADQAEALACIEAGGNVFLTGEAGTGKSTVVREFLERSRRAGTRVLVTAPTGIAALNIEGTTLHRLLGLPLGALDPGTVYRDCRISNARFDAVACAAVLLIDEVSMVRADLLQAVDVIFRRIRGCHDEPFGGVQVVLVGDFAQLPPVVRHDEEEFLRDLCGGAWAFQSLAWREAGPRELVLRTVLRQQDQAFIDVLNAVRCGDPSCLDVLNARVGAALRNEKAVSLCTTNRLAEEINAQALRRLPGEERRHYAVVGGKFPEGDRPTQAVLSLKVGARVMVIVNAPGGEFVNGDTGEVAGYFGDNVLVRLDRGHEVEMSPFTWEAVSYRTELRGGTVRLVKEIMGSFSQIPLRHAWACTIHKSQGLTLENIRLHLGQGVFAPGQLYVALSRVRSLEGLSLSSPLTKWHLVFQKDEGISGGPVPAHKSYKAL